MNQIILFDGVCNLCSASVQFILKHEKNNCLKFSSLQSNFSEKILKNNNLDIRIFNSIIFKYNDNLYFKSNAIFRISKYLKFPFNLISIFRFLPLSFTDYIYDLVVRNRYLLFGKSDICYTNRKKINNRFIN